MKDRASTTGFDDLDVVQVLGRCADFCDHDGPKVGVPLEVHGPWCISREVCVPVDVHDLDGRRWEIAIELARRYRQGTYRRDELNRDDHARLLRISAEPVGPEPAGSAAVTLHMTAGAARSLAAALVVAASRAEQLTVADDRQHRAF